jgi:alpha-L-fucosidase 2
MKNIPTHCLLAALVAANSLAAAPSFPPEAQNLKLTAPIRSWDEALPLGNGLMGGLLWGEGNLVRLSLDRGDLWDERPSAEPGWWKKRTWKTGGDWDGPYNGVTPTKLPAGRLEITLDPSQKVKAFELHLATAEGSAQFSDGGKLEVFYSAAAPVALLRIPGPEPRDLTLLPSGAKKDAGDAGPSSGGAVAGLGYPPAQYGKEGRAKWYVQEAAKGLKYCACLETRRVGNETLIAVTVTSSNDDPDLLGLARRRCATALEKGYAAMLQPHVAWWKEFWGQSSVAVPEAEIQNYYVLCRYYYGAASRRGAPPMPLQGVWTADNGGLPPWKGDYHNDLNTQMTYIGYQVAGNFDEGACYLDFLTKLTPVFTEFARDFYGTPGLSSPGVMSLAGQPLGGWGQYSMSPTMTAWNAHLFYLHWRYTMDARFLRDQAYPWCKAAGECIRALLKPDEQGVLKLPRSSSPEIFDNSARAWLIPNSNYDLYCMKMQFLALSEMADALDKSAEAKQWHDTAIALGDFHTDDAGMLLVDAKTPLPGSHRHLSNIMGLFPFNLITCEGGPKDRQRIKASLAQWDKLGTGAWCGYSFAWMSCLRARTGDAEAALRNLDIFVKAFILRNGFHVNGDQTGSGFSGFTYRPFTLEGNFAALQAVHEMLLQSWSPTPGQRDNEIIRIFPATPWRWHNASFTDLRAEGGHRVSATRENNVTTWFQIVAGKDGAIRIRDNFGGSLPKWNRPVAKTGDNFVAALKQGDILEATLAKPAEIPPEPANLAEPVVISAASGIRANKLPLRIGAASDGSNRFKGDMARIVVANRAFTAEEVAALADPHNAGWHKAKGIVLALDGTGLAKLVKGAQVVPAAEGLAGKMYQFDGTGYLEVPHRVAFNGNKGLSLAAWIRPSEFPSAGMRIIDKCPVSAAQGYLLDTYPGDSLRLITRDAHLIYPAKLPVGKWTHVAATVDGTTGKQVLYVNGRKVAEE